MFMTMLIVAGALVQAQAAAPTAPTAVAGRTIKDLPNTTVSYYDVQGTKGPAIEKSLKKVIADRVAAKQTQLVSWDVGAKIMKRTTGTTCTVTSATSTLTAKVHLPRLVEEAKVQKEVLPRWRTYVAGIEVDAAANLWFVRDRLPAIEQSMVGIGCDQASPTWNAGLENLKTQLNAFAAQRAAASAAVPKPKG